MGVWCFLIPVFATVCHRMIPFFTASVLPQIAVFRPWWVLGVMVGGALAHGAIEALGPENATWLVDLPAAAFLWILVLRWGIVQSLANRLLAMLHFGFVWYAIALTLFGVQSLLGTVGYHLLGLAPLHALTMGFCSSLLVAMVTRVTAGIRAHARRRRVDLEAVPAASARNARTHRSGNRPRARLVARGDRTVVRERPPMVREVRAGLLAAANRRAAGVSRCERE